MKCSFLSERHLLFARSKNKIYTPHTSERQEHRRGKTGKTLSLSPLRSKSPKHEMPYARGQVTDRVHAGKQAGKIAEAIILQAIEDLWSTIYRQGSIKFFAGEGFAICARIAGMGMYEKLKVIQALKKAIQKKNLNIQRNF